MLDYSRYRVREALTAVRKVILATGGPAGVQVSEVPCQAIGLDLYVLVPRTSDHLFNLEHEPAVTVLSAEWELKGEASVVGPTAAEIGFELSGEPGAGWYALVRVNPFRLSIRRATGWGNLETIDLESR